MKVIQGTEQQWMVVLEAGDEVVSSLQQFASDKQVTGAAVTAIGVVKDPKLGYFDIHTKTYTYKTLEGEFEVLGMSGNLGLKEGQPFLHVHIVLGDQHFNARGGHLFSAVVTATLEVMVNSFGGELVRLPDERTGLWGLGNS